MMFNQYSCDQPVLLASVMLFHTQDYIHGEAVPAESLVLRDVQGAAAKADADRKEAAKKEIAELMAKAKADMDKEDKKDDAIDAQHKADEIQKEVSLKQYHSAPTLRPACLSSSLSFVPEPAALQSPLECCPIPSPPQSTTP